MVFASKEEQERERKERISKANSKRESLTDHYRARNGLSHRPWTTKGTVTRAYGQGAQNWFNTFPSWSRMAPTGEFGVALYDMWQGKKDLDWLPERVDIFVAVPAFFPALAFIYDQMCRWLDRVRAKGFDYHLAEEGSVYKKACFSFDFQCRNATGHVGMTVPIVRFSMRVANSVVESCGRLDLTLLAPIVAVRSNGECGFIVQGETKRAFKTRDSYCRYLYIDEEAREQMREYENRGFRFRQYFLKGYYRERTAGQALHPELPYERGSTAELVPVAFVATMLARPPTKREKAEFGIAD